MTRESPSADSPAVMSAVADPVPVGEEPHAANVTRLSATIQIDRMLVNQKVIGCRRRSERNCDAAEALMPGKRATGQACDVSASVRRAFWTLTEQVSRQNHARQ